MKPNFTIRIYGIYIKDGNVLLSKEHFSKADMLKFPGGGLEFGEGTIDCLVRELKEEFNLDIEVTSHFFTTDFFVASAFHPSTQVMSIYYHMQILNQSIPVGQVFEDEYGTRLLSWASLHDLDPQALTFPIDQRVVNLLKAKYLY